jgi:hypothetical protein
VGITLDHEIVADYVLQVNLTFRPKAANTLGSFNIWRKNSLFGSSDELMKFCPANGCSGFFRDSFHLDPEEIKKLQDELGEDAPDPTHWPPHVQRKYTEWFRQPVLCSECGTMAIREQLPDSYGFNMSKDKIADRMAMFFDKLSNSADIYMVRTKEDMAFQRARQELLGNQERYAKLLERARDRDSVYYGLKDILRDTATASKAARFRSLLGA